jgi:hypothetical protein
VGNEPGHAPRLYWESLDELRGHAFTPEGVRSGFIASPDGTIVAARGPDQNVYLYQTKLLEDDPTGRCRRHRHHHRAADVAGQQSLHIQLRAYPVRSVPGSGTELATA